jgi:hypothetical protein
MSIVDMFRNAGRKAKSAVRNTAVAGLVTLASMGLMPDKADAGMITDFNVSSYNQSLITPSGYGGFDVNISITNPYDGTIIDSATIGNEMIEGFADSITSINPNANREDIVNYFNFSFDFLPSSDYKNNNGWSEGLNADGKEMITNNGIIPGATYPEWTKDGTAILHGTFDAGWLDIDGLEGYNSLTDATINVDWNSAYNNAVIANSNNGTYGGNLPQVTAVPEPATLSLLALTALAISGRKPTRRTRQNRTMKA